MGIILLSFLIPSGIDFAKGFSEGRKSHDREEALADEWGEWSTNVSSSRLLPPAGMKRDRPGI